MSYYGGRAYRQASRAYRHAIRDTGPFEWVCRECGMINQAGWEYCDDCGFDTEGKPPLDESEFDEDNE